jgi:tripartite ATP-independent transporter DctM subunit
MRQKALTALEAAVAALAASCLAGIVALVLANVVGRYAFGAAIAWSQEAAQWLFVDLVFLGIPLAQRSRLRMAIDLIPDAGRPRLRAARLFAVDAIVAATLVKLALAGGELVSLIGGVSPALQMPQSWLYAIAPTGAGLGLALMALARLRTLPAIALGAALALGLDQAAALWAGAWPVSASLVMTLAFLATLAIGVPVALAMLFSAFLANVVGDLLPPAAAVQNIVRGTNQFLLLAIPLFIAAGALLNLGGLSQRLFAFAAALVGHRRGGLAQVNVVASMLYAGISGSSNANAVLSAKVIAPQMIRAGYRPDFTCAVVAAAAILDNIIPPSVAMLILSAATGLSVGALFVAGVLPGLLFTAAIMIAVDRLARRVGLAPAAARAAAGERRAAFVAALPMLAVGVLIVGGIRVGAVTATEAGVLAIVYAGVVGGAWYRAIGWAELRAELRATAIESAAIGLLIGAAVPFAFVLSAERVPVAFLDVVNAAAVAPWAVLLAVNVVMIAAGVFIDIGAAILIFGPLFLPLMQGLGVDPIHYGLIVICNVMIHGIMPPVGILAYIASAIVGVPARDVFVSLIPFVVALLLALAIVTYVPAVSLGLGWLLG